MPRSGYIAATGVLLLGLTTGLAAQQLHMPTSPASTESSEYSIELPGRGMSMEAVLKRFGEPQEKYPAVGKPPITRWVYPDFTVYFESQFVIHAVVNNG